MLTCTKLITDIPFAHRQHTHAGHCRFIHGHNWAFELTFAARELDACGFVIDFGGPTMKDIKKWINDTFDHKLVLNKEDPLRGHITDALVPVDPTNHGAALADITVVPDASCEGLAKWVFHILNARVGLETNERVQLTCVRILEDSKNYATFQP